MPMLPKLELGKMRCEFCGVRGTEHCKLSFLTPVHTVLWQILESTMPGTTS